VTGRARVTRARHPFEGTVLEVLGVMRKQGRDELLVVLPDGSKTLMPAAWTDYGCGAEGGLGAADHVEVRLASAQELLCASVLVRSLSARAVTTAEQAARMSPTKENERAACTAESDTGPSPSASPGGGRGAAGGGSRGRDQDAGTPDGEGGHSRAGAR
jgi:hypothetical protein